MNENITEFKIELEKGKYTLSMEVIYDGNKLKFNRKQSKILRKIEKFDKQLIKMKKELLKLGFIREDI